MYYPCSVFACPQAGFGRCRCSRVSPLTERSLKKFRANSKRTAWIPLTKSQTTKLSYTTGKTYSAYSTTSVWSETYHGRLWKTLNVWKTDMVRTKSNMVKWGGDCDEEVETCLYGEQRTDEHLLSCTNDDPILTNTNATGRDTTLWIILCIRTKMQSRKNLQQEGHLVSQQRNTFAQ